MKVTAERVPDSQVVLEIEVEPERVERSLDQAYRRLANKARIPGFRPGKAPRQIIERTLGHEALMQEALDKLVPEAYREAVTESAIEPIDQPDFEVKTLDPVVFTAKVAVRPTVDLGDYRSIRVTREPVSVPAGAVDEEIEVWRRRMAVWEPVERGLTKGDLVRADIDMSVDGKSVVTQDDAEFLFRDEIEPAMPGLIAGIEGATKGETKSFASALPDDFRDPALRGVEAMYTVAVKEIKEQKLPELDADFAKSAGEGFESVAAFRAWVAEGLDRQANEAAQAKVEEAALEALVQLASMEYPQVLIDHEIGHLVRDQVGGDGDQRAMEQYLARIGRSVEQVKSDFAPAAIERVKRSLVMNEFAKVENIDVTDEDVVGEIDRIAARSEQLRNALNTPQFQEQLRRNLLTKKTLGRLGELTAVDGAAAPAKTPRTKKSATATLPAVDDPTGSPDEKKPARSRKKTAPGDAS